MAYIAHESNQKQIARKLVLKEAINLFKTKKNLTVFSLPSTNFYFETQLTSLIPNVQIECVEYDKTIFKECLNKAKEFPNLNLICLDAFEYLEKASDWADSTGKSRYDLVWLDLCGFISHERVIKLAKLVQSNLLSKNGVFAVTFMASRERDQEFIEKLYNCSLSTFRDKIFPALLVSAANLGSRRCELIQHFKYRNDNEKAAPMGLYIFKTKKVSVKENKYETTLL